MTEESTPLETSENPTSDDAATLETVDISTPENVSEEPENDVVEADQTETGEDAPAEEKLYAGKYKTVDDLEKGYKEASKFISKASELEKKLKAYQEREDLAKQQREIAARQQGFNDVAEQQLSYEVANHEYQRYVEALETSLSGDAYNKAKEALSKYQQTGNVGFLDMARSYFNPSVIAQIAKDTALYEHKAEQQYYDDRYNARLIEGKKRLEDFALSTKNWLDIKERQDIIGMAFNLTDGNLDFEKVKDLVDALEQSAVNAYIAKQKELKENLSVRSSLQTPGEGGNIKGEHWLTREEYNNLTPEQESKMYDKIVKQIELENAGKLPRQLT